MVGLKKVLSPKELKNIFAGSEPSGLHCQNSCPPFQLHCIVAQMSPHGAPFWEVIFDDCCSDYGGAVYNCPSTNISGTIVTCCY